MREAHAIGGARQVDGAAEAVAEADAEQFDPLGEFDDHRDAGPGGEAEAQDWEDLVPVGDGPGGQHRHDGGDVRGPEAL